LKRVFRYTLGVLLVVILVAFVGAFWLVGTESGLRTAWRAASGYLPEDLTVGAIEGRLAGPLTLRNVSYKAPTLDVSVERVFVDWELLPLLARRVHMTRLELENAAITSLPDSSAEISEPALSLPDAIELPVEIRLDQVVVDNVTYRTAPEAEPIRLDRASVSGQFSDAEWLLEELLARGPLFDVAGRAAIVPRDSFVTDVELEWTARPPDLPAVVGRTVATGDLTRLVVDQTVAAPYNVAAEITLISPFDRLSFDGTIEIDIDTVALERDLPSASVAAAVSVSGTPAELALGVDAEIVVPEFDLVAVDLQATLTGDVLSVEQLQIEHTGTAARITSSGRVTLGDAVSADLALSWSDLRWPLEGEAQVLSRAGALSIDGTLDDYRLEIDSVIVTGESQGEIVARGAGSTEAVEVSQFEITALGGELVGEGRVTLGDSISADLALSWSDLRWPLEGEARVSSRAGTLSIDGTLDDYRLAIDAAIVTGETQGEIVARGVGSTEAVELSRLDITALGGALVGTGRVQLEPGLAGQVVLAAANIDPGILLEGWGGSINGNIEASGRLEAAGPHIAVETLNLSGTLRERDFELDVRGELTTETIQLSALRLASGASLLEAQATVADIVSAEFSLNSDDLADFWPGWSGQVSGTGSAVGPRERPRVTLDARGTAVELPGMRVADLGVRADIDLAGADPSELLISVQDGAFVGTAINSLTLAANGTAARHQLTLEAEMPEGQAELRTTGRIANIWQPDVEWTLDLEAASLSPATLGGWQLSDPSQVRITTESQTLERSCLQHAAAELCVEASSEIAGLTAGFSLSELPFGYFAVLSSQLEQVEGSLSASGRYLSVVGEDLELTASLSSTEGRLVLEEESDVTLAFGPIAGEIVTGPTGIDAEFSIPIEGDGDIALIAKVGVDPADESFTARPLTVDIDATLAQLSIVAELFPDLGEVAGRLVADIVIAGTVGSPEIRGQVELTDARLTLTQPNLVLEELNVRLTSDGTGPLMLQAAARSGQGNLDMTGEFSIDERRGSLSIEGQDFEAVNTADLQATVSPDLEIVLAPERIDISGNVTVPTARITPFGGDDEGVIGVSADQVIVLADTEETESALLPPVYAEVGLAVGDDVNVEALGLVGRLAGGISITEIPGEPVTASGSIRIENGTYTAYGQELEIRTGRLLFVGGPVERPGLDIEAVRRPAPDVLVGARVRGTLAQPELSLFSEPPMIEQEQLSYLVFGRPLGGGNSSSEASALAQAALALGLRGGNFVSELLNERLGFDEFGIQSTPGESAETASFVIGRYLSPSLYVSYGVGLFDSVSTLQMRYRITERWRVETESSDRESGGDIIWSVERSSRDRTN
jgi:translocation and assembly module TamB